MRIMARDYVVVTEDGKVVESPHPIKMSHGAAAKTSSVSAAATFTGGGQSDVPNPLIKQNPAHMQKSSPLPNSADNIISGKRKRKPKQFVDYGTLPSSSRRRRRPRAPPSRKSHGSNKSGPFGSSDSVFENAIQVIYGDIVKDCYLTSSWMRRHILSAIVNIVKEIRSKRVDELDIVSLQPFYDSVRDIEKLNVNVKWLLQSLDQIKKSIISRDEIEALSDEKSKRVKNLNVLRDEKSSCWETLEEKEQEVESIRHEIKDLQEQVALESMTIEDLNYDINTQTSKYRKFKRKLTSDGCANII